MSDGILLGKIIVRGLLKVETGLHIGASKDTMEIGGIDTPVIRDPITNEPYIPGSSLKGKMRSLFERVSLNVDFGNGPVEFNQSYQQGKIKRHECESYEDAQNCHICRLFGTPGVKSSHPSRLIVRDLRIIDESLAKLKEIDTGLQYTEWKFENSIDRITSAANPRQIERIPAGTVFSLELIYNIEEQEQVDIDKRNIQKILELLENDYLGGHGSRGYGKISIEITEAIQRSRDYYLKEGVEETEITL